MFAICIESSHSRGMGHFYRMLNFIKFLELKNEKYIVFINDDDKAASILLEKGISFTIVNLYDFESDWESTKIKEYCINIWINDRLDTDIRHSLNVTKNLIKLVTFDDRGNGSEIADINIAGLAFENTYELKGKKVFTGIEYLILNREINSYKRIRESDEKLIVTLGGSDTYGVTIKVIKILKTLNKKATIIVGPSFEHKKELEEIVDECYIIKSNVPSLIQEFSSYDIAITGGGITPFEANASGLPCIIIANELHEIQNARYLETLGSSIFGGYHKDISVRPFNRRLNIKELSKTGIEFINTTGVENIYNEIMMGM